MQGRLNPEAHGGYRGPQRTATETGGRPYLSTRDATPERPTRQELRGANGPVCATIEGDCLKKQVDGSRHFLHKPAGIAFDAAILETAERAGVRVVRVRDRETGDTYTCQLADFAEHAVKLDRGYGLQWCLSFVFWRIQRAGEPVQLSLL